MKNIYFATLLLFSISSISFSQNGLSFDGTNDYVNCGNGSSLNITGTAITLEAWIYPTSWRTSVWQGNIISKEGTSGTGYMLRAGAGGKLNVNVGSGGPWNELTSSASVLTLNTWQHVAATFDGSFLRLYVNGVLTDSASKTVSIVGTASVNLYIGESPGYAGRYFPGIIDEVRIWDVVRTKAEIAANMNTELCTVPASVKAYYTFNQGTASGTNTSVTTATDFSANSNIGTLTNFALSGTTSNWVTGKNIVAGTIVNSYTISACGSYTMPDGRIITSAGIYYDTLPSSTPCDSLNSYSVSFPPAIIRNTVNDSGCLSYLTPSGTLITTSGTYYDTVSTSSGCDTTIQYNIVISAGVDDSVYQTGNKLTSFDTWAPSHQWVRCNTGFSPISGATTRTYTPTGTGNYAVIVTRGVCKDTSDCFSIVINHAGIEEENIAALLELFPNPATDYLTIKNSTNLSIQNIEIVDISGKTVLIPLLENEHNILINELNSGVYFIRIVTNKGAGIKKMVKR